MLQSSMTYKTNKSSIVSIKTDDPTFLIKNEMIVSGRASFEIARKCPVEYKDIITECLSKGWLRPVAHMTEREMMISGLLNDC